MFVNSMQGGIYSVSDDGKTVTECLGVLQALRQGVCLLDVVIPDFNLMTIQLPKARKRPQGIEVVVENGDPHHEASRLMNVKQGDLSYTRRRRWEFLTAWRRTASAPPTRALTRACQSTCSRPLRPGECGSRAPSVAWASSHLRTANEITVRGV